jgi:hypothetical protein
MYDFNSCHVGLGAENVHSELSFYSDYGNRVVIILRFCFGVFLPEFEAGAEIYVPNP